MATCVDKRRQSHRFDFGLSSCSIWKPADVFSHTKWECGFCWLGLAWEHVGISFASSCALQKSWGEPHAIQTNSENVSGEKSYSLVFCWVDWLFKSFLLEDANQDLRPYFQFQVETPSIWMIAFQTCSRTLQEGLNILCLQKCDLDSIPIFSEQNVVLVSTYTKTESRMWNLYVPTTVDCSLTLSWTVLLFASGLHFNSAPWPRPMPPQLKGNRWAVKKRSFGRPTQNCHVFKVGLDLVWSLDYSNCPSCLWKDGGFLAWS